MTANRHRRQLMWHINYTRAGGTLPGGDATANSPDGAQSPLVHEHPPASSRQRGQVQSVGTVSAQERQLGQLRFERLRGCCGRAAPKPRQAGDAQVGVSVQQPVRRGGHW